MKALIIGASGEGGKSITRKAISKKLDVIAYVRTPAKLEELQNQVLVIKGDLADVNNLRTAMQGVDVVISCVGAMDNSPAHVETFKSGMENIISAMKSHGIKRLISINGALTKLKGDKVGPYLKCMRWIIPKLIPQMILSNMAQYNVIAGSELDWTVIRAGKFKSKSSTGKLWIHPFEQKGFNWSVSKEDLGDFVISQTESKTYLRKAPFVFS